MGDGEQTTTVPTTVKRWCCKVNKKVVLGIAKVLDEKECGVSLSELADYNDFGYTSQADPERPVGLHLEFRFCPWCGTRRDDTYERRTVEAIHGIKTVIVRPPREGQQERS